MRLNLNLQINTEPELGVFICRIKMNPNRDNEVHLKQRGIFGSRWVSQAFTYILGHILKDEGQRSESKTCKSQQSNNDHIRIQVQPYRPKYTSSSRGSIRGSSLRLGCVCSLTINPIVKDKPIERREIFWTRKYSMDRGCEPERCYLQLPRLVRRGSLAWKKLWINR